MKRLILKKIDSLDVVRAVEPAAVDPVKTARKIKKLLKASDEFSAAKKAARAFRRKSEKYQEAKNEIDEAAAAQDLAAPDYEPIRPLWDAAALAEQEHAAALEALATVARELENTEKIYFDVRDGEILVADHIGREFLAKLASAKNNGRLVLESGDTAADNRGKTFWKKIGREWAETLIAGVGIEIPEDAIAAHALTPEQRKEIMFSSMTDAEIKKSISIEIKAARTRAALMKTELEIEGDADALEKARTFFKDEKKRIRADHEIKEIVADTEAATDGGDTPAAETTGGEDTGANTDAEKDGGE